VKGCVFCGGKPLTLEHVWPQWLANTLPWERTVTYRDALRNGEWEAPLFSLKVRRVCASCNSGWMSELEIAAKRMVTELIMQPPGYILIPPYQQKIVALWALKTSMMLEWTEPKSGCVRCSV
jgi:hypothetical protein